MASRNSLAVWKRAAGSSASSFGRICGSGGHRPATKACSSSPGPEADSSNRSYRPLRRYSGARAAQKYSTSPSENRSERASTARPRACSGDMKSRLPVISPVTAWPAGAVSTPSPWLPTGPTRRRPAWAIPKSSSLAWPVREMRMFSGVMSRWTSPSQLPSGARRLWAYSSAASTWSAMCRMTAADSGRCLRATILRVRAPRSRPATYSAAR